MVQPIHANPASGPASPVIRGPARPARPQAEFATNLREALRGTSRIRFSAHATQRLEQRAIAFSEAELSRIADALDQLAAKGARESLLLTDGAGLVANVPNRTVITAVPTDELKDAVFTKIDSAIVLNAPSETTETDGLDPSRGGPVPPNDGRGTIPGRVI